MKQEWQQNWLFIELRSYAFETLPGLTQDKDTENVWYTRSQGLNI